MSTDSKGNIQNYQGQTQQAQKVSFSTQESSGSPLYYLSLGQLSFADGKLRLPSTSQKKKELAFSLETEVWLSMSALLGAVSFTRPRTNLRRFNGRKE